MEREFTYLDEAVVWDYVRLGYSFIEAKVVGFNCFSDEQWHRHTLKLEVVGYERDRTPDIGEILEVVWEAHE